MRARTFRLIVLLATTLLLSLMTADAVLGSGASPATASFGNVPLNTTVTRDIVITVDAGYQYAGAGGVSALNPPFGFDAGTCDDGGGLVGPGTCTVQESFTPTAVGDFQAQLQVLVCPTGVGSCITVGVAIEGTGISLTSANPSTVNFGSVPLNTTATRDVVITVDAGYQYAGAGGVSALNPPFGFDAGTCDDGGGLIGPGTCTVQEGFTPAAIGSYDAELVALVCKVGDVHCFNLHISIHGSRKGNLSASAECQGSDLLVTVADGDRPFTVSATRPGLSEPLTYGVAAAPDAANLPNLGAFGIWWTVTVDEKAGDHETVELGLFSCTVPGDSTEPSPSPTSSPAPPATSTPTATAIATLTPVPTPTPVVASPSPVATPRPPETGTGDGASPGGTVNATWAASGVLLALAGAFIGQRGRRERANGHRGRD